LGDPLSTSEKRGKAKNRVAQGPYDVLKTDRGKEPAKQRNQARSLLAGEQGRKREERENSLKEGEVQGAGGHKKRHTGRAAN